MFKKAVKHEAKLRLAFSGPSGSGKTFSALAVGATFGKMAVVDTEHGSASKYADIFDFDVLEVLAPYHPDKFVEAIKGAEADGYDVIVLDSITHAWSGAGGVLEIKDHYSKQRGYNDYTAWGPAFEAHDKLVNGIVGANIHVIATMRSKTKYVMEDYTGRDGKVRQKPVKAGMGAIQRDGMEYEFDVHLEMTPDNEGIVTKSRCIEISNKIFSKPGGELGEILIKWLTGEPVPEPELPFEIGQEVIVKGATDEKLGEFVGLSKYPQKLRVKIDGKEYEPLAVKVQAVVVEPTQTQIPGTEPVANGAHS